MNAIEAFRWIDNSITGERLLWHTGFVAMDRGDDEVLDNLADVMWRAQEDQIVDLVQRRLGRNQYQYIAIRRDGNWQ